MRGRGRNAAFAAVGGAAALAVLAGVIGAGRRLGRQEGGRPAREGEARRAHLLQPDRAVRDEKLVWVVNPGADSVSIIGTATKPVLEKITVGDEPRASRIDSGQPLRLRRQCRRQHGHVMRILDRTPGGSRSSPTRGSGPRAS